MINIMMLAQSLKKLRKSNNTKKGPLLWGESAMDGMPRRVAGAPGKGTVSSSSEEKAALGQSLLRQSLEKAGLGSGEVEADRT